MTDQAQLREPADVMVDGRLGRPLTMALQEIIDAPGRAWLYAARLHDVRLTQQHLSGANLARAILCGSDLRGTDLAGANLRNANLRNSILTGVNLEGALLENVCLSGSRGLLWAKAGPVGSGRREVLGVWVNDEVIYYAGCFSDNRAEFLLAIECNRWEWSARERNLFTVECRDAMNAIDTSIHRQLRHLEILEAKRVMAHA